MNNHRALTAMLMAALCLAVPAAAQRTPRADYSIPPCCFVTRIDRATGVVTSREVYANESYWFSVRVGVSAPELVDGTVRSNAPVWLSLRRNQVAFIQTVSLTPLYTTMSGESDAPHANRPCCAVTRVNPATGDITGTHLQTGRTFSFRVGENVPAKRLNAIMRARNLWLTEPGYPRTVSFSPLYNIRAATTTSRETLQ